jgi:uncharacterized membrane protein
MNWIFYSVFTAFLWGLCYTCAEQVISKIDKTTYVFISSIVSLLIYGIMCRHEFYKDLVQIQSNGQLLMWLFVAIAAGNIGCYMSMLAIETSNASLASALEITYPFWCMFFAWMLLGQTLTRTSIMGIVIVFAGVIVTILGKK